MHIFVVQASCVRGTDQIMLRIFFALSTATLVTMVSCASQSSFSLDSIAIDSCSVTSSIVDQDLVATARYRCDVPLLKAYLSAQIDVESGVFEFGRHTQYIACGSSVVELTERYLVPPGVVAVVAYASAGLREGAIHCDSRDGE